MNNIIARLHSYYSFSHAFCNALPSQTLVGQHTFSNALIIPIGPLRFVKGRSALRPLTNLSQLVFMESFRKSMYCEGAGN